MFQSTRLRWTRRGRRGTDAPTCGFNPRVREGRDLPSVGLTCRKTCFNPRVRDGRDEEAPCHRLPELVSIHASARDATVASVAYSLYMMFQSTRPRGTRLCSSATRQDRQCFNPRVREGRDPFVNLTDAAVPLFQSTRPRGTRRQLISTPTPMARCFNPRVREGRDSRPPAAMVSAICFNPRVREGRDYILVNACNVKIKFQSTRPRGTRRTGLQVTR